MKISARVKRYFLNGYDCEIKRTDLFFENMMCKIYM